MKKTYFPPVFHAMARLHRISQMLREDRWVTRCQIAEAEEVSIKTVARYIDFLRDMLGWEIEGSSQGLRLVARGKDLLK